MKLSDLIEKNRCIQMVDIRDENNMTICICRTNSKGVIPYLHCEVLEWFAISEQLPIFRKADFCVLIKSEEVQG